MKKLKNIEMESINGFGDGQDFLSGFACAAGLLTAGTGLGLALAIVGCSTFLGDF